MKEAKCKSCGKKFKYYPSNKSGKYCSPKCHGIGRRKSVKDKKPHSKIYEDHKKKYLELGLCSQCGNKTKKGSWFCESCKEKSRANYKKNKKKKRCTLCKQPAYGKQAHCDTCRIKYAKARQAAKQKVIDGYGGKCLWCGIADPRLLCIDHVNNDGAEHRRRDKGNAMGGKLYKWLIEHNFPKEFQVLCHNCNFLKHFQRVSILKEIEIPIQNYTPFTFIA